MTYDPTAIRVVPRELLDQLAAEGAPPPAPRAAPPPPSSSPASTYTSRLLVEPWLTDRGVGFRVKPEPEGKRRTVYVLKECPFNAAHGDPDSCVMQAADGKMSAQCFHSGCAGRGWQEFKKAIGPPKAHHYDPPLTPSRRSGKRDPIPRLSSGSASASAFPSCEPDGGTPDRDEGCDRPTICVEPESTPVAATMRAITDCLLTAGDCFRRADQLVRITGPTITPVLAAPELSGVLNNHVEFLFVSGKDAEYRPLPTNYANTWLNHPGESARLPVIKLFTHNPVFTTDWRLAVPGYDPCSGIYNAGPAVEARGTTENLDRLLAEFCFRTPGDRTNYVGMLLTAILIPRFIGSKPAVIFNGNQPGLGKSILAQIIAILRDGKPAETASYNPNDEEFEKRLGSIVRRGVTTIIVDNAKGNGRNPRIDSACLERSITDAILSFRLLGYSREIRAENSHIFCITANTPDVSRDLVTRSVVVGLYHEGDPAKREFALPDPEGYAEEHRVELLGELIGMIERWRAAGSPMAKVNSRFNKKDWGPIVGGILATCGFPDFLANAGTVAAELDDTRREFAHLVAAMASDRRREWLPADLVALATTHSLLHSELGDGSARAHAIRLGLIAGRYVNEQFPLSDDNIAVFRRTEDRRGKIYRVEVELIDPASDC